VAIDLKGKLMKCAINESDKKKRVVDILDAAAKYSSIKGMKEPRFGKSPHARLQYNTHMDLTCKIKR